MRKVTKKADLQRQDGFILVGLIVAIFLILLVLGIAAPKVARDLRREREVEAIHRGNQYVRALQLYYRKQGHYPGSMDQLEKTNNVRYLRQRFPDPMTGKPDWKLIHVGEAKTTLKGYFGKPLSGLTNAGGGISGATPLGSSGSVGASSSGASGTSGSSGSSFGSSSFGSSSSSSGSSGSSFGSSSFGSSSSGSSGSSFGSASGSSTSDSASGTASGTGTGTNGSTGVGSQSATTFGGSGAPIMGFGTAASGNSITVLNEQTTYPTWEFVYDPRIEQLKAKVSLLGGGMSSSSATASGLSTLGSSGSATSGTSGSGSSFGSSSFGSGSSGSSFGSGNPGSSSGSGSFGSSGSGTAGTGTSTPPQ